LFAALVFKKRGAHEKDDIVEGKADDLPEQAFLYVGSIDEVREKAKEMAK
jgi:F0F1-type ATP synthase beta subunit